MKNWDIVTQTDIYRYEEENKTSFYPPKQPSISKTDWCAKNGEDHQIRASKACTCRLHIIRISDGLSYQKRLHTNGKIR